MTVQLLVMVVPGLRSLLGVTPLTLLDSSVIGCFALFPFVINEASKSIGVNYFTDRQTIAG